MNYLITNTKLDLNEPEVDIAISDGVIKEISSNLKTNPEYKSYEIVPGNGTVALSGLVDLHTHLREPGKEDSETVATGSMAAVRGGFTAISAMPNTSPVADTAGLVEQVFRLGEAAGLSAVFPIGAVTKGLAGKELAEIGAMADSVAQVQIGRAHV